MTKRDAQLLHRLTALGFQWDDACKLRRIEMTLQRWTELECGDGNAHCSWGIERDETTELPYMVIYPHVGKARRRRVPDREKGALKRLRAILATYPEWTFYHQTDPRGCALYLVRKADLNDQPINQVYTRGVAVCG